MQWEDVKNMSKKLRMKIVIIFSFIFSIVACTGSDQDAPCLTSGSQILEKYFFSEANLGRDLWSLVVLCVSFHVLGCLCLWWKTRGK